MPKITQARLGAERGASSEWVDALHPKLQAELAELKFAEFADSGAFRDFVETISASYRQIDSERRGIASSMQLMADEAQALANEAREQGSEHLQVILDHIKDVVMVVDESGVVLTFNPTGERVFGYTQKDAIGRPLSDLVPNVTLDALAATTGDTLVDLSAKEVLGRRRDGQSFPAEIAVSHARTKGQAVYVICMRDATERNEHSRVAAAERDVFEQLANHGSLQAVLASVTRLVDSSESGSACAVHVLAPDGHSFASLVSERLPERLRLVLERSGIGEKNGAAACAVRRGAPVIVADAIGDPVWQHRCSAIMEAGTRATWALPIKGVSGKVLGALCVYRSRPGLPSDHEMALMSLGAQLGGIAIERRLGEEALRSSEAKFRGLFESVMEGVYQSGRDGRFISVNPAFVTMLGYSSAEEIYGLASADALYWNPADRQDFIRRLDREGQLRRVEFALRRKDGAQIFVMESTHALRDPNGRITGYEGVVADITERKHAEQEMFAEKERAQVTLQSIGDAVVSCDPDGRVDYLNPVAEKLTGWPLQEARGRPVSEVLTLINEATKETLENPLERALGSGDRGGAVEHPVLVTRSGQEIAIQESAAPISDRQSRVIGAVMVFHDVTKERRLKRALSYQASHDALTGLINRREFDNRVHAAVLSAQRGEALHVLLYIDLDQFKVVNDTCGHQAGDRLLRDITGLLQARVRASDTIARLGGDEFGLLLESCTLEQATRIAEGIRQSIRDYRFVWGASTLSVGASIGLVELKLDTDTVASVLSAADLACYAAKDEGRNRIHVYDFDGISDRHREMHWVSRVNRATEEDRLELCFQPIVRLGAEPQEIFHELTVRMRDDGALVLPGEFIPAAERYNVMPAIDRWVIRQATQMLRDWPASKGERPILAVNISGTSLNEQSFLEFVLQHAGDRDISQHICFEITETAAVTNLSIASYFMRELKSRGCKFALDDFGSGLSSFMYLKSLPVDFLKIEGQFISRIAQDPVDRSMVEAVAKLGKALGMKTIAESVETEDALEVLKQIGVDYVQGYHIARPLPLSELGIKVEPSQILTRK